MCFLYSRSQCPSTYDRRTYDSAGWVICLPGCLVLLWRRRITVLANPWVETATRSSILAWRIPWTEEPGGLQSMGPQRAGHDWAHTHNDLYTACRLPNVHPRVSTTDFLVLIFNSFSFEASDQAIYHSPWVFIYSKTQSHIFSTQIGWQIRCLKVWPWRGFLLLLSGDHPEWYWSTATIHFQLAPMYQDHSSMNLTKDFPSSVNQSSLALQRST